MASNISEAERRLLENFAKLNKKQQADATNAVKAAVGEAKIKVNRPAGVSQDALSLFDKKNQKDKLKDE